MFNIDILKNEDDDQAIRQGPAPFRHLALIGNSLPRKCGLATYTSHVAEALRSQYPAMRLDHYAMDDRSGVTYSDSITTIDEQSPDAYLAAAERINASGAEAIWLQHEYGIFGGIAGSHILELVGATDLPLILTLHTVLDRPSEAQEVVLRRLISRAERTIVMASTGAEIVKRRYGVAPDRLRTVPHGVPDRRYRDPEELKSRFGWNGRKILMTFGLLAPDKGIRHMIEAMPEIVSDHPDALYEVIGATHPNQVRHDGERHRQELIELTAKMGVQDHVRFTDRFVDQEDLLDMLQAADIYVTPYLNMEQVTSGTLSYAVAVGKPVISTPYLHARELVGKDRGVLVPPADGNALATAARELLGDAHRRHELALRAYELGRTMLWPNVVEQSLARLSVPAKPSRTSGWQPRVRSLPLDAIERMSDAVGILQHAVFSIPDRRHGYCIDDNARALMVMVRRPEDRRSAALASTYAAFVQHGWNGDCGQFRNFMGFDRRWLEEAGSEDSNGRAIWALGLAATRAPWPSMREWAMNLFDESASIAEKLSAPRARAFAAFGALEILKVRPLHEPAATFVERSAEQLLNLHHQNARSDWDWFETSLAYDNARLPEALIRIGEAREDRAMVGLGHKTLGWLTEQQTGPRGSFRPVGCKSFNRPYAPPLAFDQQPLEATATIDAAAAAFRTTGDEKWRHTAQDAFAWFFGDNDAGVPLAEVAHGSCFDGLMATGINRNQGAESILSLHLAALTLQETFGSAKQAGQLSVRTSETRLFAST